MTPRLKELYYKEIQPSLKNQFGFKNLYMGPKIEKIILNKPETGYLNYKDLVDRTSINQIKLKNKYIVFKPIFIKIKYTLQIEEYMFKLISFIDLSNRENNIIYRTISDENIYF